MNCKLKKDREASRRDAATPAASGALALQKQMVGSGDPSIDVRGQETGAQRQKEHRRVARATTVVGRKRPPQKHAFCETNPPAILRVCNALCGRGLRTGRVQLLDMATSDRVGVAILDVGLTFRPVGS